MGAGQTGLCLLSGIVNVGKGACVSLCVLCCVSVCRLSLCLSVFPSFLCVCVSVYLCVSLSFCLSLSLSFCLTLCLSFLSMSFCVCVLSVRPSFRAVNVHVHGCMSWIFVRKCIFFFDSGNKVALGGSVHPGTQDFVAKERQRLMKALQTGQTQWEIDKDKILANWAEETEILTMVCSSRWPNQVSMECWCRPNTQTHTRTHTHTRARTHARTHTHLQFL